MAGILIGPAVQGGMAEGAVITGAGAMQSRAGVAGGGMDPDYPGRGPSPRDLANAVLAAKLASAANTLTQIFRDNQDNNEKKCKTFQYSEKGKECKGGKAHHIVPDRDWRSPGDRGVWTNVAPIDLALNDARQNLPLIGKVWKGGYYYDKMDEGRGLCICLSEKEHALVHAVHDPAEAALGQNAKPMYTTNLKTAEELAAKSVSSVTGCDEKKILDALTDHHRKLGFHDETVLRADPYGNSGLTADKFLEATKEISRQKSGNIGF